MLGTLEEYQKTDWIAHVPTLVYAYNATIHDSTGYSPYFLMFGRHPRLSIDAFLGLSPDPLSVNSSILKLFLIYNSEKKYCEKENVDTFFFFFFFF